MQQTTISITQKLSTCFGRKESSSLLSVALAKVNPILIFSSPVCAAALPFFLRELLLAWNQVKEQKELAELCMPKRQMKSTKLFWHVFFMCSPAFGVTCHHFSCDIVDS